MFNGCFTICGGTALLNDLFLTISYNSICFSSSGRSIRTNVTLLRINQQSRLYSCTNNIGLRIELNSSGLDRFLQMMKSYSGSTDCIFFLIYG